MSSSEDGSFDARPSLKTLRRRASSSLQQEDIAGRPAKRATRLLGRDSLVEVEYNSPTNKETQASFSNKITIVDLTDPNETSVTYWKLLAVKRQSTLNDAYSEIAKLRLVIEGLKKEKEYILKMLDEASSFIEVIKEELNKDDDDTGIDVKDVTVDSSANEVLDLTEDDGKSDS